MTTAPTCCPPASPRRRPTRTPTRLLWALLLTALPTLAAATPQPMAPQPTAAMSAASIGPTDGTSAPDSAADEADADDDADEEDDADDVTATPGGTHFGVGPTSLLDRGDPEPVVEPIRSGGPNKPYTYGGQTYVPDTGDGQWKQTGIASWYGRRFHGKRTASGEIYNLWGMTAAHVTLPIPSYARIVNPKNGRSVIVRINDRGPFARNRILDLSWAAAAKLGLLHGSGPVEIERITHDQIRSGEWKVARDKPVNYEIAGGERLGSAQGLALAQLGRLEPVGRAGKGTRKARGRSAPARAVATAPMLPSGPALEVIAPAAEPTLALALTPPDKAEMPSSSPLKTLQGERAGTQAGRGWWLQLGSFRTQDLADGFYQRLGEVMKGIDPLLTMFQETQQHKVQAGPFETREEASRFGSRLRELLKGLSPTLVERK
ncbi:MAG TPA: septal ring lytic transglycosylase RlpA family protein [Burkholderiaceae bacterium]|nr:septal ring lytic transglycosylase RlpA family protein [Burkholderiaceae bacterium]